MLFLKRKHDEMDDSEEDEPSYGRQILPVANLPDDFHEEPMDGLQYLFTVRRTARQLPDVVCVQSPFAMQEPPGEFAGFREIPSNHGEPSQLPSEEWRETFEYRFLNFRKNLNQPTIHVGPPTDGSRRLMPEKKDRDMWWAFLEGKPESDWTPLPKSKEKSKKQQYQTCRGMRAWPDEPPPEHGEVSQYNDEGEVEQVLRVDPADSLPSPVGTPVPLEYLEEMIQPSASDDPLYPRPREPTTKLLKLIDGRAALHLLMYFTHWIQLYLKAPELNHYVPTESHARWMFGLLSCVEDQVSADDMNLLRNLARACIALLQDLRKSPMLSPRAKNSRKMGKSSCWFVIAIVADVWKQRDLWMDAEQSLAKS